MTVVVLLLLVGGIALTQSVSDPRAVTLMWLRLGGIISITLLAIAMVVWGLSDRDVTDKHGWTAMGLTLLASMGQLMTVQLGWRRAQRACAVATFALTCTMAAVMLSDIFQQDATATSAVATTTTHHTQLLAFALSTPVAAGLLGGSLMTMLLGHAYLTAGNEMTQAPFRRLALLLAAVLGLRLLVSLACGAWPYMQADTFGQNQSWNVMLITARYAVGLVVPAVFTYMILDCVNRRANQSATGILYVTIVLIVIGEGTALALVGATGQVF